MSGDVARWGVQKDPLWIFGYGSLVWRPAFAYDRSEPAVITGWARRLWQGSVDHRGVPGAPGRVATLVPDPGMPCWGLAYRVPPPQTAEVLARLDVRERGGYERYCVEGQLPHAREAVEMLLYRAGPANPHYLGPAPLGAIADQVRSARGPSGPNVEYVTELAHALRAMDANDSHVFDIEALL